MYGYKITHKSGKFYYGIVLKENKTVYDRLNDHRRGWGSSMIKSMIAEGCDPCEFEIELILETDDISELSAWETTMISEAKRKNPDLVLNVHGGGRFIESSDYVVNHPNWKRGRDNYRKRLAECGLNDKEKKQKIALKTLIKNHWGKQTDEYIAERTSHGLSVANDKSHVCNNCGRTGLTKGNLRRWHNEKCRIGKT